MNADGNMDRSPSSVLSRSGTTVSTALSLILALGGLAIARWGAAQTPSTNALPAGPSITVMSPAQTNILAYTNQSVVVVITNIVPAVVVTNTPAPVAVTNAAPKPEVVAFPPDKEIVVVAAEDCGLMAGQTKLAAVPSRTLLVVDGLKGDFASVAFGGTNGWVPLGKCLRLGKSPPEAEVFCRKGLRFLSSNDVQQASANLFIASALEPSDRSYLGFLNDLAKVNETLNGLVEEQRVLQEAHQEADQRAKDATFLKQKVGLDDKAKERREEAGKERETKAKAAREAVNKQQAKSDLNVRSFGALFGNRIESLRKEGNIHMTVALDDFKSHLVNNPRFAPFLKTTNFVVAVNLAPVRTALSTATTQYETGVAALSSNLLLTASRNLDASLKTWPQNKLARQAQEALKPKLAELDQLRLKVQQLKQTNDVLGLEVTYATIGSMAKDFEKLDEQVAANRKILIKARELLTAANQRLEEQKPFECQDLVRQAAAEWKLNPDLKGVTDRLHEKYADVADAVAKIPELEKGLKFGEIVKLLQGFKEKFAQDALLARMETEFAAKDKQCQDELKKAQALEKEGKRADAFEIYRKWNSDAHVKRLGRSLGAEAEKKGEKDKAIGFYERAGLLDDVKRLRPAPPPAKK